MDRISNKDEILTPEAIRSWRIEKGLTQRQLALILGVGEVTINRWESNESNQRPTGTSAIVLASLIAGQELKQTNEKKDIIALIAAGGGLAAGYLIWKYLSEIFDE